MNASLTRHTKIRTASIASALVVALAASGATASEPAGTLATKLASQTASLSRARQSINNHRDDGAQSYQLFAKGAFGPGVGVGVGVTRGRRHGWRVWSIFGSVKLIALGLGAMVGLRGTDHTAEEGHRPPLTVPTLARVEQTELIHSRPFLNVLDEESARSFGPSMEAGLGWMHTRYEGDLNVSIPLFWSRTKELKLTQKGERLTRRAGRAIARGNLGRAASLIEKTAGVIAQLDRLGAQ